jgi:LCP family protein required for cell wall assembly
VDARRQAADRPALDPAAAASRATQDRAPRRAPEADGGPPRRPRPNTRRADAQRSGADARRAGGHRAGTGTQHPGPDVQRPDVQRPDVQRPDVQRLSADRIDETLTRLTAAHAGLVLAEPDRAHDRAAGGADAHDPAVQDPAAHDPAAQDPDAHDPDAHDGRTPGERPPAHPAVRAGRLVAAAVAVLLVLVSGLGWVGRMRLDGALQSVAAVDVEPDGVLDAAAQTGDRNVLVLATDSGRSTGATTRANTVAVVHVDARGDRTVAVTLPPDLEITRPPCERWDTAAAAYAGQTVPAEPRTTFDSAYAVGGPRCATRAAQQVTGLAITGFVAVDLAATSALVEAVGGVDVCVERPVLDAVVGPVLPAAGTAALNGPRAGDLVRAADVRDDPAPATGLVQRQQRVLAAVLARALSPERLLHPGRVSGLRPALGAVVVSTGTGVDDLLAVSRSVGRPDGVTLLPAPTESAANSRGNQVLRDADAAALFTAVRTGGPLPAPDPAGGRSVTAPSDVTADVLNASGRVGLATQVAGTLGEIGFRTGEVTNAAQPALDTVVRYSPDRVQQAQLLAAAVPSASAVPDPGTSGVLQLVLGRSFDGTVRAAAAPPDDGAADPATAAPTVSCN